VEISNRTDNDVWLGLYNLYDTTYWATIFSWGARKKIESGGTLSVDVSAVKIKVIFWDSGALGSMLAAPKALFTSAVSVASDASGTYVYNHQGAPGPIDKIDHVVVLVLENRSFDNLLGWLYAPGNQPSRNIPSLGSPTYAGLTEGTYWNTPVAMEHDTAPESARVYAGKVSGSDRVPDPDPSEVCSSFVEGMFGTKAPAAGAVPNMWGFLQNYTITAGSDKAGQIMNSYTPDDVPVLSWLAKSYAVCDRWFGPLPAQTWPSRSFLHAGTSFGRLNNCNPADQEDCIPNFNVYAGQRTIFDVLDEQSLRWLVVQDAFMVGTLISTQFWTIPQKMQRIARPFDLLGRALASDEPPQYVFIEPSYGADPNDMHPPHKISSGETLLRKVYEVVSTSPVWNKTALIITFDEHGGCYDHIVPPPAIAPDDSVAQFAVGSLEPFKQHGPRVPAIVVSPYIEAGTVFRGVDGAEYDHTSILASLRDWIFAGKPDILGPNPRIAAAPTIWDVLTRDTPRGPETPPAVAAELRPDQPAVLLTAQLADIALSEAERQLVDEAALGNGSVPDWQGRMAQLADAVLAELGDVNGPEGLPADLLEAVAAARDERQGST